MKIKIHVVLFALFVCGVRLFAQQAGGVATRIQYGTVLPSDAPQWSIFTLVGSGIYQCQQAPVCTSSSQWLNIITTTAAGSAALTSNTLNFGTEPVGQQSQFQQKAIVNNVGTSPFIVTGTVLSNADYQIVSSTCTNAVSQSGNCVVTMSFKPSVSGADNGTLTLSCNATQCPLIVTLSGTGTGSASTPTSLSSLAISPSAPAITLPGSVQLSVTGTYSDSSVQNITTASTWGVSGSGTSSPVVTLVNKCSQASPGYSTGSPIGCSLGTSQSGDLIVVYLGNQTSSVTYSLSDTLSDSFTCLSAQTESGQSMDQICYTLAGSTGTNAVSAIFTGGSGKAGVIQAAEFSGNASSSYFDTSAAQNAGSSTTSMSSGNATTSGSSDIEFCGGIDNNTGSMTAGSGLILLSGNAFASAVEYKTGIAAGTNSGTMTDGVASSTWQMNCAWFNTANSTPPVAAITQAGLLTGLSAGSATVYSAGAFLRQLNTVSTTGSQSTVQVPLASAELSGDTNLVFINWQPTSGSCGSVSSVSDTSSPQDSYTSITTKSDTTNGVCGAIYYANPIFPSLTSTVLVTFTAAETSPSVTVKDYGGLASSSLLDVDATASGKSTSPSVAVTTVNATDLVDAFCGTPTAGVTLSGAVLSAAPGNGNSNGNTQGFVAAMQSGVYFSAQTVTFSVTASSSNAAWICESVAFETPVQTATATVSSMTTGTARYISPTGSDSNSGASAAAPWLTFAHALSNISPGYTLVLANGLYNSSNSTTGGGPAININCGVNAPQGSSSNPVTIVAANERQAEVDGQGYTAVYLNNCQYYTVQGLTLLNENVASLWGTAGCSYHTIDVENSLGHISILRNLINGTNGNCNAHGIAFVRGLTSSSGDLIQENEVYNFHRHGIFISYQSATIRRNYVNPRGIGDATGCQGTSCQSNGHFGYVCYPCANSIFENNISEGMQFPAGSSGTAAVGFDEEADYAPGINLNNEWLGNISLNDQYGFRFAARCEPPGELCNGGSGGLQPYNDTFLNNVVYQALANLQSAVGLLFYPRGGQGSLFQHNTMIGFSAAQALDGLSADYQSTTCSGTGCTAICGSTSCTAAQGGGTYSVTVKDSYISKTGTGVSLAPCSSPCVSNTGNFDHLAFYANTAISSGATLANTNSLSSNPLPNCIAWIPSSSALHGVASDSGDEGANVLYEYVNGTLGSNALWSVSKCASGQTSCFVGQGAIFAGLNDQIGGKSLFDIGGRLNINQNSCSWPSGYTPN